MQNNMCKKNIKGFSMIELSIVLIVLAFLIVGIVGSKSLMGSARVSNAQNLTVNAPVTDIDGLSFWFETSMISKDVNVNDEIEGVLRDFGPNRFDITQNTVSKSPVFMESEILNGLKSVYFDGNNACILANNPINAVRYTAFAVLNPDSAQSTDVIIENGGSNGWQVNMSDVTVSSTRMLIIRNNATNRQVYSNGSLSRSTANVDATGFSGQLTIGCAGTSNGFGGEIAEVIIYNRALFDDEIAIVQEYLEKKYKFNF